MSYSKTDICNMALQELDNKSTVTDVDNGKSDVDILFKTHFDRVRKQCLRLMSPNFARARKSIPLLANAPAFGYSYAYKIPEDSVRVFGIGEIQDKKDDYVLENVDDVFCILTDRNDDDSLPIRYVKDVTNYDIYTDDFITYMAKKLALAVRSISQNITRIEQLKQETKDIELSVAATNGQENPPMRRTVSRFQPRVQSYSKVNKR